MYKQNEQILQKAKLLLDIVRDYSHSVADYSAADVSENW